MTNGVESSVSAEDSIGAADPTLSCIADAVLYALVFAVLHYAARYLLRRFCAREADYSGIRVSAVLIMALTLGVFTATLPYAHTFGWLLILPVTIAGAVLLNLICWASWKRAAFIAAALTAIGMALTGGGLMALDLALADGRMTLARKVMTALHLTGDAPSAESGYGTDAHAASNAIAELDIEKKAVLEALELLRRPEEVDALAAAQTGDLRALNLITSGSIPSPAQWVELGIAYRETDESRAGLAVLRQAGATQAEVSDADVRSVMALLKSIRPIEATVTPRDAAIAIHTARQLAEARAAAAMAAALAANRAAEAAARAAAENKAPAVHPFLTLPRETQQLWLESKKSIAITAIVQRDETQALVMVDGELIRPGDIVPVQFQGRTFAWRFIGADGLNASWEPVLEAGAGQKADDKGLDVSF